MGNSTSTSNTETLQDIVDYIATDYILTMSYQNLQNLDNPEYCNNLVMLTSDILKNKYTHLELNSISNRNISLEKIKIFNKDTDDLDPGEKQQVCNHISKFYVKIAHVFAAILKTINPMYMYQDIDGITKNATLYEKYKIPKDTLQSITNHGFCSNRIKDLTPTMDHLNPSSVFIQPKCETSSDITEEPGINELMDLYYDEYDENGEFSKMSDTSQQLYKSNLKLFYTTFTGNESMPDEIIKFNDIKLKDYRKSACLQKGVQINTSDTLFIHYADNMASMIYDTNQNQNKLLKILDKMFVYRNIDDTQQVSINPKLNAQSLQKIVVETRVAIIDLYLTCEEYYAQGIKIYEAIVENNIRISLESQIKFLQKEAAKHYL